FSPGTFLMTKILEQFCAEGVEEVDFGLGDAPYKQRFGNCWWEEASIDIFAPTLKGLRINALRTPAIFTEQVVKKTLEKTQILPRIKRLWRNRAMKVVQHDSTDSVQ
ncbi:MAG: GNAT family N-acetyltransferase, partial [Terriglobales bacterium]